jgi:hypothetical protein
MFPRLPKKLEVRHTSGRGWNSEINGRVAVGRHRPIRMRIMPIFLEVLKDVSLIVCI